MSNIDKAIASLENLLALPGLSKEARYYAAQALSHLRGERERADA